MLLIRGSGKLSFFLWSFVILAIFILTVNLYLSKFCFNWQAHGAKLARPWAEAQQKMVCALQIT